MTGQDRDFKEYPAKSLKERSSRPYGRHSTESRCSYRKEDINRFVSTIGLDTLSDAQRKAWVSRMFRALAAQGLVLTKSRQRIMQAADHGLDNMSTLDSVSLSGGYTLSARTIEVGTLVIAPTAWHHKRAASITRHLEYAADATESLDDLRSVALARYEHQHGCQRCNDRVLLNGLRHKRTPYERNLQVGRDRQRAVRSLRLSRSTTRQSGPPR